MNVPFHKVEHGKEEVDALMAAVESNWFSPRGPEVPAFAADWAAYVGKKGGVACSSGTAAIHLALLAAGIGPGDRVAVPTYTCSPTVFPVSYVGAQPVFIDCELETYGMEPGALRQALEDQRWGKVDAVIDVHLYGAGCKDEIVDICQEYSALLIEDACESVGGLYRTGEADVLGKRGDISCFSFRGDKVLTALGTGGILLSDGEELLARAAFYCDLGLRNDQTMGRYRDLPVIGFNYEMSNPAAAFGREQIKRLPQIIDGRRQSASVWREALSGVDYVGLMDDYPGHVYYQMPLLFKGCDSVQQLDELGERLLEQGVPFIPPFWPMHWQPMYRNGLSLSNAEYAATHVLLLPCYPALTDAEIAYMASVVAEQAPR